MAQSIVQHRRGTQAAWEKNANLVLKDGEIGVQFNDDGTTVLKVGDGTTPYKELKSITADSMTTTEIESLITESISTELGDVDGKITDKVKESVDALTIVDGLDYVENKLYLMSNGNKVGEPIEITGGSGTGGGGYYFEYEANLISDNDITISSVDTCDVTFSFSSCRRLHGNDTYIKPTGDFICEILVQDVSKATMKLSQGTHTLPITDYLMRNRQEVKIKCTDVYGNTEILVLTVNVVELILTPSFRDDLIYNKETYVQFTYKPYPNLIQKNLHLTVDNVPMPTMDIGTGVASNTIDLDIDTNGVHTIEAYLTATVGGKTIPSETVGYEFIYADNELYNTYIASYFPEKSTKQGKMLTIPYQVYYPDDIDTPQIFLTVSDDNGVYSTSELTADKDKHYWYVYDYPIGENVNFTISCNGVERTHTLTVEEGDVTITPSTNKMVFYLSANNRTNLDSNRNEWTYEDPSGTVYTTTLTDFNWGTNGWVTDDDKSTCLRVNGDARAVINFKPFADDFKLNGKTIEFDFAVRDVNAMGSVAIECVDYANGGIGFYATADTASLTYSGGSIKCYYRENKRVRVSIVVDTNGKFLFTYLDGVLSGARQYTGTNKFNQDDPQVIRIGSSDCTVDLYTIRVYNTPLTASDILSNYMYDMSSYGKKVEIYNENDIYEDSDPSALSYEKVKEKIPTVTFIGKLPVAKGDKKKNTVRMIFEHPTHPELNFDEILKEIDVQGTSSAGYARKNWKVKTNSAVTHMAGELPASVFCLKVDYAEATGTHNTQNANIVETLYTKKVLPQLDNEQVRTTITGYPIAIFVLDTDDMNVVKNITPKELEVSQDVTFYSKGNFNFDKGAENVFGFTDSYDTECWEFCENTSDAVNFLGEIPADYSKNFEARYHKDLDKYEDLVKKKGRTDPEAVALQAAMIVRFKEMHDWVRSTDTGKATNGPILDAGGEPISVTIDGKTYNNDTKEYRLAKFKKEFSNYFDEHYTAVYYVYTFFALMVDQRAKNLFLTYWRDKDPDSGELLSTGHWYPYFYDNDTSFGINNEGERVFDYYHEDTDKIDATSYVYNGHASVLWNNFREAFPLVIRDTYHELRSGALTEDKLLNAFITNGSDMWSAAMYNEDAESKYICWARPENSNVDFDGDGVTDNTSEYLYQVRGNGENHLEYFLSNRFKYCDSKWYSGKYFDDLIYFRAYTPSTTLPDNATDADRQEHEKLLPLIEATIEAVPPSGNITIVPYATYYAGVKYGATSGDDMSVGLFQAKVNKGVSHTFIPPTNVDGSNLKFNDIETYIYGASYISSIADLSPLYCDNVDVSHATRLTELTLGNQKEGYTNFNLKTVTLGSNKLLKTLDVTNCINLKDTLNASGCIGLKKIYAKGTALTNITLPPAGYIEELYLPDSMTTLVINNQVYLNKIEFNNYKNLERLCIDNCPKLDATSLLDKCKDGDRYTVKHLRLTGLDWEFEDVEFLMSLSSVGGSQLIGDNEMDTQYANLVGTCKIGKLTGTELRTLRSMYPNLTITYDTLELEVNYYNEDGSTLLYTDPITVNNGSTTNPLSVSCPITSGKVSKEYAKKDPTNTAVYTWGGWSTTPNSEPIDGVLNKVIYSIDFYVAFVPSVRMYKVWFYNGTTLLNKEPIEVEYGGSAHYEGESTLVKPGTNAPYEFSHWYPTNKTILGDTNCYAQFSINLDRLEDFDIQNDFEYKITNSTLTLMDYLGSQKVGKIPSVVNIDGVDYNIKVVGGFSGTKVEYVYISEGIERISDYAFSGCTELEFVHIPSTVKPINEADETAIGTYAFKECIKLSEVNIPEGTVVIPTQCFIDCTGLRKLVLPSSIKKLNSMCLYRTGLVAIAIPDGTHMDWKTFRDSTNLKNILFMGTFTASPTALPFQGITGATFWTPTSISESASSGLGQSDCNYIIKTENGYPIGNGEFIDFATAGDFYSFIETYGA